MRSRRGARQFRGSATRSFVRTFAGGRATARTSGLSARLSSRRRSADGCWSRSRNRCVPAPTGSRLERDRSSRHVRDQPLPLELLHLLVGADGACNLAGIDVDVMALEVKRAFVPVDGRADLVRRRVGDPVILRLERPGLREIARGWPPSRSRSFPANVAVALGAQIDIIKSRSFFDAALCQFARSDRSGKEQPASPRWCPSYCFGPRRRSRRAPAPRAPQSSEPSSSQPPMARAAFEDHTARR